MPMPWKFLCLVDDINICMKRIVSLSGAFSSTVILVTAVAVFVVEMILPMKDRCYLYLLNSEALAFYGLE
ncbi:hypothetical protein BS17DRAFT_777407 [Gyrodon lividus]|nr:hypothetical protein BS17DRAFT_777407 [Gyrodon lividus]